MIVSHRHKFIFIKTMKTGGTSLELALSSICGPDDILTTVFEPDENARKRLGFRTAQNYHRPMRSWKAMDFARFALRRVRPIRYEEHHSASMIRELVGETVWSTYYKFTIARNPWDRVISHYFWDMRDSAAPHSLNEHLLRDPGIPLRNWWLYTIDGSVAVDQVILYEAFGDGLEALRSRTGIPASVAELFAGITTKAHFRDRDYLLQERDVELIGMLAEPEIRAFGYEPPAHLIARDRRDRSASPRPGAALAGA